MSAARMNMESYREQITRLTVLLNTLNEKRNQLAWLRFGSVVAAFVTCYLLWSFSVIVAVAVFILLFALFLRVVVLDARNKNAIDNTNTLIEINNQELKIAAYEFTHRDDGLRFLPATHAYAADLDIFGRASLYQYINRTTSEQGKQLFSSWLLAPASERNIRQRQEAGNELAAQIEWRQQLHAFGIADHVTIDTEKKITGWLKEENNFLENSTFKTIRIVLPALSLLSLLLCIAGILPAPIFFGIAFLFFITSGAISRRIMPLYDRLNKIASQINTLSNSAQWIESAPFKAELLQQIHRQFNEGNRKSSADIKLLKTILDRFDIRLNPLVFIPLNTLFFWDLQQAFALEKWKYQHKEKAAKWFAALANMESLSSIATIRFNHPQWCMPLISHEPGTLNAENLGHPLIPESKRINNSFATTGLNQLALITGSNMAGKSTFLRSIGINVVLAMMGSPVCAKSFTTFPVKIMSSMRIADNLEENTSTFYAELKKLKDIIEAVNRDEPIYILLDEILRGTNSLDRHTGSQALIKQLIHRKAVGMIATHDVELAKLVDEYPANIHNYYFDVQVANDELYFDYKLKEGVCQSMNASILMKKIGIEL